jgi:hypothetical protein
MRKTLGTAFIGAAENTNERSVRRRRNLESSPWQPSGFPVRCCAAHNKPAALSGGESHLRYSPGDLGVQTRAALYVPANRVLDEAKALGAIPYDIPDVEFTHEGERCSFDTFLRIYDIADPPLERLSLIVRGADTSRHDLTPQCGGLFAISLGLSTNSADDQEMLDHGMVIYDALYTWCRNLQTETHSWPPH